MGDDGSFSERVKKTFGSLLKSVEPSSLSNPLWSMTGTEVEKREWRRDKDTSDRDSNPCFNDFLSRAPRDLSNYSKEFENDDGDCDVGFHDWDVRSSIGLDSTLDHEEEEDAYDKVALGRENAGHRLYMKDITGKPGSNFNSQDDVLNTIGRKRKDPRANHCAARIRLKEDAVEAAAQGEQPKGTQAPFVRTEIKHSAPTESVKVKPILKRKEYELTSKPTKRVRFNPGCTGGESSDGGGGCGETIREAASNASSTELGNQDNESLLDERVQRVPDYVQNPSKYKCYNLDSIDNSSHKSSTGAFLDLFEIVKRSKNDGTGTEQTDSLVNPPKSVTFIPKKKLNADKSDSTRESTQDKKSDMTPTSLQSSQLGIAAHEDSETESGDMEIDGPEPSDVHNRGSTFAKQGRQYRSKSRADSPA